MNPTVSRLVGRKRTEKPRGVKYGITDESTGLWWSGSMWVAADQRETYGKFKTALVALRGCPGGVIKQIKP